MQHSALPIKIAKMKTKRRHVPVWLRITFRIMLFVKRNQTVILLFISKVEITLWCAMDLMANRVYQEIFVIMVHT